jgi:hypothetical protein
MFWKKKKVTPRHGKWPQVEDISVGKVTAEVHLTDGTYVEVTRPGEFDWKDKLLSPQEATEYALFPVYGGYFTADDGTHVDPRQVLSYKFGTVTACRKQYLVFRDDETDEILDTKLV